MAVLGYLAAREEPPLLLRWYVQKVKPGKYLNGKSLDLNLALRFMRNGSNFTDGSLFALVKEILWY